MKDFLSSSWLNGEYVDIAGFRVCIDSSLSFASFESYNDDICYTFQGNEADEIIGEMTAIWNESDLRQDEVIDKWIRTHL